MMEKDINILLVHEEVRALERLRETSLRASSTNPEEIQILIRVFDPIEDLLQVFERKLFGIVGASLILGQQKPSVLLKAIQAIEREENLDMRMKNQLKKKGKDPEDPVNRDRFKFYRNQAFQSIQKFISQHFDATFADSQPSEMVELAQKLLDDLPIVLDDLTIIFPEKWKIFEFFAKEYHIRFNTILLEYGCSPDKVHAKDIIDIVGWVKNTYEPQIGGLGYDAQPPLSESLEPLYDIYRAHIRKLMGGWAEDMVQQDVDKEPETVDGLVVTLAPSLMFESLNIQISIARDTNDSAFFYGTMVESAYALGRFHSTVTRLLKDQWRDLPMEWIMAQSNNCNKICDQIDDMVGKIAPLLEDPFDKQLPELFEPVSEEFHKVAKLSMSILADLIFADLVELLSKLFTKEWYDNERFTSSIIATLRDYYQDIDGFVMESVFRKFAADCLDRLLENYIIQLFESNHVCDEKTVERLNTDYEILSKFFSDHLKESAVEGKLQVLKDVSEIIDAEAEMLPLYFHSILKSYPDMTMEHLIALLSLRKDLNKTQMAEAVEACEKTFAGFEDKDKDKKANRQVFSRIKLPSKFDSLFRKRR
eukprot:TRINITY_DN7953_c0_g1_i1.p1 TRINITY_DN7953_c0_g1~~TRINITY_DN7953_c0_g1_i1.p1  ORF type:complete len:592 (-),score=206.05 TRINITY_DN7953_c0_g1_i1:54-1829(-)